MLLTHAEESSEKDIVTIISQRQDFEVSTLKGVGENTNSAFNLVHKLLTQKKNNLGLLDGAKSSGAIK